MTTLSESDWKRIKRLHPIALDRYCERVLGEVRTIEAAPGLGHHEKYVQLYQLLRERGRTLGRIFNDLKRSSALLMSVALVNSEELNQFSTEARGDLTVLVQGLDP